MSAVRGEVLLGVVTIVAAAGWVFSKKTLEEFPPFSFLALRFFLAAVVLMLVCWPQLKSVCGRDIFRSVLTGILFGITLLVWVSGLAHTSLVGESAFIVSLSVVVVPIVGRVFFSEKIPFMLFLALMPALMGLAMLTLENAFTLEKAQWFFIAATLGFAIHLNLSSHFVHGIPSLANTTVQLFMVSIVSVIAAAAFERWPDSISASSWMWLLLSAIVATSFRFALQNKALQLISPSHASIIFLLEPVWTVLLSIALLGEMLSPSKWVGCLLIFTALLVYRGPAIIGYLKS